MEYLSIITGAISLIMLIMFFIMFGNINKLKAEQNILKIIALNNIEKADCKYTIAQNKLSKKIEVVSKKEMGYLKENFIEIL